MLPDSQRAFFRTGATRDLEFRKAQLARLRAAIVAREAAILDALKQDLGRPAEEAYTSEIGIVLHEIDVARKGVAGWARPRRVRTPPALFPATSRVQPEPYGRVLIIAPWNYPFQLAIAPLAAAIAAGNCAVVKPSEAARHTSRLVAALIGETFDPQYVAAVEGGVAQTQALLAERFDYIFFTGAAHVGRSVMAAAAKHLTPVTLELGGKNPCIVEPDADLAVAARRIAWGKFVNAGQTCIAPDFVLAHKAIRPALVERLVAALEASYGKDPLKSPDYGRVIDERHFDRLAALMRDGAVAVGGQSDRAQRYIAPTVLTDVSWDSPAMQDEIFGPILPVLEYEDLEAALQRLQGWPTPLVYCFTSSRETEQKVLDRLPSGGACINDAFGHFLNLRLPFGGRGESGMGAYHGKAGFDTFSHRRSVVRRATWLDPGVRYPPYKTPLAVLRRIISFLL
jgi:acyl-CoA reductase-like NAD-dependent aldehyde dehydrogenase